MKLEVEEEGLGDMKEEEKEEVWKEEGKKEGGGPRKEAWCWIRPQGAVVRRSVHHADAHVDYVVVLRMLDLKAREDPAARLACTLLGWCMAWMRAAVIQRYARALYMCMLY